eukprot:TRINITY_DN59591_c0_g1_i1.p2 TRINITY_DN59591_c0_g1~~TRINITY_DN59591_c0_g1_i1.p2  ORF type:complete len:124 (+),score=17.46 TRINITY_DN59591_c0_g1_i1:56-427(+)
MGAGASTVVGGLEAQSFEQAASDQPNSLSSILDRVSLQDGIDYRSADTASIASRLFYELDTQGGSGTVSCETLVELAKDYFSTQLTVQPEHWIRSQILKHDADCDGALDSAQFAWAVESLRRC